MNAETLATATGWVAVGLGGWLMGSFLNQLVDRLPDREVTPPGHEDVTLFQPLRSVCLACGRPIAAYDNLPILSYLWLRGRCRHCGASIGRRTLVLEIVTPLIVLGIFTLWGWQPAAFGAWLAAGWTLVAVPLRLEGQAWSGRFQALGVALYTFFFWLLTLGWFLSL